MEGRPCRSVLSFRPPCACRVVPIPPRSSRSLHVDSGSFTAACPSCLPVAWTLGRRLSGVSRANQSSDRPDRAPVVVSNLITVTVILTMSLLQVLRREVAPLCTLGVIVANIVTKGLKQLVMRTLPASVWRRPEGSRRDSSKDPGFPSSHTSIMTFISVYFALYLGLHLGCPFKKAVVVAVLPSGTMAAARIWDKDHTIQQTIGGVAWGCCMGMWWALIGPRLRGILEWAEPQPWALVVLCFGVACLQFAMLDSSRLQKGLSINAPRLAYQCLRSLLA